MIKKGMLGNQAGPECSKEVCHPKNVTNNSTTPLTIKVHNRRHALTTERANFRAEATLLSEKLVEVVRDGKINTVGQRGQFFWKMWYLPSDLKDFVWFELSKTIDHDVFRELRAGWMEYSGKQMDFLIARKNRRRFPCK